MKIFTGLVFVLVCMIWPVSEYIFTVKGLFRLMPNMNVFTKRPILWFFEIKNCFKAYPDTFRRLRIDFAVNISSRSTKQFIKH